MLRECIIMGVKVDKAECPEIAMGAGIGSCLETCRACAARDCLDRENAEQLALARARLAEAAHDVRADARLARRATALRHGARRLAALIRTERGNTGRLLGWAGWLGFLLDCADLDKAALCAEVARLQDRVGELARRADVAAEIPARAWDASAMVTPVEKTFLSNGGRMVESAVACRAEGGTVFGSVVGVRREGSVPPIDREAVCRFQTVSAPHTLRLAVEKLRQRHQNRIPVRTLCQAYNKLAGPAGLQVMTVPGFTSWLRGIGVDAYTLTGLPGTRLVFAPEVLRACESITPRGGADKVRRAG